MTGSKPFFSALLVLNEALHMAARIESAAALRLAALILLTCCFAPAQSSPSPAHARSGAARPRNAYVGAQECAGCHPGEAASQATTPMAHALSPASASAILRGHSPMILRNGPYAYKVSLEGNAATFAVSAGGRGIAVPILWAFGYGTGEVGQTYVFRYGGFYYESQVSYYSALSGLGITIGHIAYPPASLGLALGYPLQPESVRRCFACHATNAVSGGKFQPDKMIPGVSCEACHGPGARHVASMKSGDAVNLHISNPGRLSTAGITAFCGSCHRTAADERALKIRGPENDRFQGYRITLSRCYSPTDSRISCTSCHNPHEPLVTEPGAYDAKCEACHSRTAAAGPHGARACPVATRDCVTCHMPKVEVPGAHFRFTDHFIRIARANEPYPG